VDVDAQLVGICCGPMSLKGWDPKRYAALVHPGDELAYDIFSQAIRALRHPSEHLAPVFGGVPGLDPMRGMTVKHLVAGGASQAASELTEWINRGSVDYSARAQISWISKYFEKGTMGPSMPRLLRNSAGEARRDSNGLAEGGVRQPFIQAPVAYNAGTGCPLFGTYRGWTPAM